MIKSKIVVIIPALNEEHSIGIVISHIPREYSTNIIVADNGSSDKTVEIAKQYGAEVVIENQRGYGSACLAGIAAAKLNQDDIVVFLDGDFSDFPEDMTDILNTMKSKSLDLVIGSRTLGKADSGALMPQAIFGNWLATRLLYFRYGFLFSDLGPFRAIRASALNRINMRDKTFGWTVEMQLKALKLGLRVGEVPVRYRKRIGVSKITGTVKGTILAGTKILWTIFIHSLRK